MTKKPIILHSEILAETQLFCIERRHLQFSNGAKREFECINGRAHASVMIVPMLDEETFLLIREYACGMHEYILGFPKGAVSSNENLLETANRELQEEVGYGSRDLQVIAKMSASPGYMDSIMHLVLAKALYPKRMLGDEPEEIEVIPWKLSEVDALLAHPEFYEARSQAALLMIERKWRERNQ